MSEHDCYTDDWQRTNPDLAVYLPAQPGGRDEYADHIHIFDTPGGDLMAIWTQASFESAADERVVFSRSTNGGESWSPIEAIAEAQAPKLCPSLGFPVISRSGRMYCLYNQHLGIGEGGSPFPLSWPRPGSRPFAGPIRRPRPR